METVALVNQKGGVGKSTTAYALAAGLQRKGYKVLAIDIDPQGDLSYCYNARNKQPAALSLLTGTATLEQVIVHTENGDIIPAEDLLATADAQLNQLGKEYKLKEALEGMQGQYDYCIIDCPPALGVLTTNALAASDKILVPAEADIFSLIGIGQLSQTISAAKKYTNPALKVEGLIATKYKASTVIGKELRQTLEKTAEQLGTKLYRQPVRECTALHEANLARQNIFAFSPRSNAAKDYAEIINEFLEGR